MQGKPLYNTILSDEPVRKAGLYGIHGGHVNCTDGRYVYMRAPVTEDNQPLYQYTLMPTKHGINRAFIDLDEIRTVELAEPFSFTKDCKVMKLHTEPYNDQWRFETQLYDLQNDPEQLHPIDNPEVEEMMIDYMVKLMKENDCPEEQFIRLGLKE
jgi:hypothetical protein